MALRISLTYVTCTALIVIGEDPKNELDELSSEDWRNIIRQTFKKHHVYVVTLVGGEPMMRPEIVRGFL